MLDITIWSAFTKSKLTCCIDLWNSFSLTTKISSFSVFLLILILSKSKTYLFCNVSFLCWINCWYLFLWYTSVLFFSSPDKFLYRYFYDFFVFKIIHSSFFFRIFFFRLLQKFLSVILTVTHFSTLICWVYRKLFQLIHNPNAEKFV